MPITERDRTRLDALIAIVKPANSLAARVDKLTADQRDWYDGWKAHCERWLRRNGERAYALTLNNIGPVRLREDISVALFGEMPRILKTDDENRAMHIYQKFCSDDL